MKIVQGAITAVETAAREVQGKAKTSVQLAKGHTAQGGAAIIKQLPEETAILAKGGIGRVKTLVTTIDGKAQSVARLFTPAHHDAAKETRLSTERANLRGELGTAGAGSILNQQIATLDHPGGVGIDTLMDAYHDKLTNVAGATHSFTAATKGEMKTWVAMGEKIMAAIADWDGDGPLEFTLPNGVAREIPANLDTIRAVSWYLQAQAMLDNASDKRPATELGGGTMILKDDGNKLYKFFASSDNVYGRFSSHFKHGRAESGTELAPATSKQGVTAPALGWVMGQSLQNGIEDFTNKFPSNGGTMLFERLKDDGNGVGEIFIKWESVGVPDALPWKNDKHGDLAEEKATFGMALNRCWHHTLNFLVPGVTASLKKATSEDNAAVRLLSGLTEPKNTAIENRGEQLAKVFDGGFGVRDFEALRKAIDPDMEKPHGLDDMLDSIGTLLGREGLDKEQRDGLKNLRDQINLRKPELGNDLGIRRQGAEIHVDPGRRFANINPSTL